MIRSQKQEERDVLSTQQAQNTFLLCCYTNTLREEPEFDSFFGCVVDSFYR